MVTTSPGQVVADRARLERRLEQAALPKLRAFLTGVAKLAAGQDGRPFGPATVETLWQPVVDAMLTALPDELPDDARTAIEQTLAADLLPDRAYQTALDLTLEHADPDSLAAALTDELTVPAALTAAGRRRSRVTKSFDENPWVKHLRSSARTIATTAEGLTTQYTLSRAGVPEKRWVARHDTRTRATHRVADGQTVPVDTPFVVGGFPMMHPGDRTTAPPEEWMQCRCVMVGVPAAGSTGRGSVDRSQVDSVGQHELDTADRLANLGYNVTFVPPSGDQPTPDIMIDGVGWELKSPTGSGLHTIAANIRKGRKQAPNIVLDLTRTVMNDDRAIREASAALQRYPRVSRILVIRKDGTTTELGR